MTTMDQETLHRAALVFIQQGYKVLAERVLTFVSMSVASALFAVALWQQSYLSLGVAAAFSVLVFLPVLQAERKARA